MSVPLKERLQAELNEARKAREKLRTLVLSTTLSDLRNREIELGKEVDEAEVLSVLTKAMKSRKEAADQFRAAGREELAGKETAEAEILSAYLPEGLSEEKVREMVREILSGSSRSARGRFRPRPGPVRLDHRGYEPEQSGPYRVRHNDRG